MTEVLEVKDSPRQDRGREKKALNLTKEVNSPNRPSSPYFRTRSPTVQPGVTPYLGFVSPYAYMASLATPPNSRKSPKPGDDDGRSRAISEPPPAITTSHASSPNHARSESPTSPTHQSPKTSNLPNGHASKPTSPLATDIPVDAHFHKPVQRPYESRTPKLIRGGDRNKMAMFMPDLDDKNNLVTTVVMGAPASATSDDQRPVDHRPVEKDRSSAPVKKKSITIIPSGGAQEVKREEEGRKGAADKKEPKKKFSLLKSGRTGDKAKPSSPSRKKDPPPASGGKKDKKMSGRLSKLSLPNLYKPSASVSSDLQSISDVSLEFSPTDKQSFFKKRTNESVSSATGWSFQPVATNNKEEEEVVVGETGSESMLHSRSELYLSAISEPRLNPPQKIATRAASMFNLSQSDDIDLSEMNTPVTMFMSRSMEDVLEGGSEEEGEGSVGLSINSIKIEISETEAGGMGTKTPGMGTKTPGMGIGNGDIASTALKKSDESTEKSMEKEKTKKVNKKENVTKDTKEIQKKDELVSSVGEDSSDITTSVSSIDESSSSSQSTNQQFKRFTTSRKPLRKPSFGGKESPKIVPKRSPSSVSARTISETPSSPRFTKRTSSPSRSPVVSSPKFERSFRGGNQTSPLTARKTIPTTPTSIRRSFDTSPHGSPLASTKATPTARGSPKSSPIIGRKSLGATATNKARSSLTSSASTGIKPKKSDTTSDRATPTTPKKSLTPKGTPTSTRKSKSEALPPIDLINFEPITARGSSSSGSTTPTTPTTPRSRQRRSGVSSVTSPLVEDVGFGKSLQVTPGSSRKSSATSENDRLSSPSRSPLASPVSSRNTAGTGSFGKSGIKKKELGGVKSLVPPTTQSKTVTTYVYKSLKSTAEEAPPAPSAPQTFKYVSGGRKKEAKKDSVSSPSLTINPGPTTDSSCTSITNTDSSSTLPVSSSSDTDVTSTTSLSTTSISTTSLSTTSLSKVDTTAPKTTATKTGSTTKITSPLAIKKQSAPVKVAQSPTTKKPPSGLKPVSSKGRMGTPALARRASGNKPTPSSPSRSKSEGLSPQRSIKPSLSTAKVESDDTTSTILNPLVSLITSPSPDAPISPPSLFDSLGARPLSPTSPLHSEPDDTEFLGMALSPPEVPIWSDIDTKKGAANDEASQLTYIYRSTLLRKSSRPTTQIDGDTKMSRVPSNKSPHHEARGMTRTTSPRKVSLPVPPAHSGGGAGTLRKSSIPNRASMKRKSMSRAASAKTSVSGTTGGAGRPRSASLVPPPDPEASSDLKAVSSEVSITRSGAGGERDSMRKSKRSIGGARPISAKPKSTSKSTSQLVNSSVSKEDPTPSRPPPSSKNQLLKSKTSDSCIGEASRTKAPMMKTNSTTAYVSRSNETRKSIKKTSASKPPVLSASVGATGSGTLRASIKRGSKNLADSDKHRSSLRLSRRSSAGTITKGAANRGTLKRGGNVSTSAGTVGSPSGSRGHSVERDDTLSVFDDISSMAQKNLLSSVSDHKRAVRPRERQKPSSAHLQLLNKRNDISSEMDTPTSGATPKSDPNAYSTYMGKKVLDHSALLGLAAKLDFTTVKLRKTGIVEQMMNDKEGGGGGRVSDVSEMPNSNYGVKTTSHPLMLLIVKGRKNVQTRLVQPVASSVNSGDVFVLIRDNDLFLWNGKEANVIEKARGNDLVHRIQQRKELGCHSNGFISIEDSSERLSKKQSMFWEILNGKQPVNKDSMPLDDVYEKGMNLATKIYQYTQDGSAETTGKYIIIHEDTPTMPKIALLDSKKILLFDFCTEVYVWIGKKSPPSFRKPAMIKARKVFDGQCVPPSFKPIAAGGSKGGKPGPTGSPVRKISSTASGVGIRSSGKFSKQRHGTLNSSTRRKSIRERKPSKGDLEPRPDWSLFTRVNEGSENILFREKFSDWPEPGRIIKMKGHESSGEVVKPPPMPELQAADVSVMLKASKPFEGLRLDGENIHRGRGNYQVSRSTFACNRVRSQKVEKYRVKDSDSFLINEEDNHLFYSGEGYIIRWSYIITVVRELEGLTPGKGMFAMDRQYQKSKSKSPSPPEKKKEANPEDCSSDEDVVESDEECQRVLESGGRDRCAYFFWQGHHASINEKGATAIMTVEMDKEKGPQVRVVQGTEHPAFLQLFNGSMIIMYGKSDNNEISKCKNGYRLYYCGGFAKKEAYLLEINTDGVSLSFCLRSRGCYVIQDGSSKSVFAWAGRQTSDRYRQIARHTARKLKKKLGYTVSQQTLEGEECPAVKRLMGDKLEYAPLTFPASYTPRLFQLSGSTGWFRATEETHVACPEDISIVPDHFPFTQETIYTAVQPTVFLIDAHFVLYLWFGWWPEQKNALLREKNAFSGTAMSRWAQEKKLSLETALNYAKESGRSPLPTLYVVSAGSEDLEFINLFPYWRDNPDVVKLNNAQAGDGIIVRSRRSGEEEFSKYTRTSYSLEELKKRPEELNHNKLETYLSDKDFQDIFKMSKDEFSLLPTWKQVNHKKSIGIF
ncbi:PREDICTED: uncharacterized protein LOC100639454 [Amphimedon queenslandica]|uniref:HP domain-containing protein n=1 Tax=Amphimedon queenslandica TaxID=400682 RepID=A0A1X7TWX6_AMPQE|nr:PREDICTED: uncharacterized protein LOC100639454 [Amphimedon queenslandica]|eukprot:XP_011406645.2 PREDICTED: uncharacterized protein LOC100639454 [Amphimedon queenslandica]